MNPWLNWRITASILLIFNLRHLSRCRCVGCTLSPESLTDVSSSGFGNLPPSCNSNDLGDLF
ncbi:hypothetical protein CWS43_16895 [Rahnella sp. AA]|nr:hypothetical protein CWS43_16895 [Rahnella sp. AA]